MKKLIALLAILTVAVVGMAAPAAAADKDFKLGVLFSLTGPFAPAGALAGYRGTMVAVDMINARGGIAGKYKVVPVVADAQSNPGRGHSRGPAPDDRGKGARGVGRVLQRHRGAPGAHGRQEQEDFLGDHRHLRQGGQGPQSEVRVPRTAHGLPVGPKHGQVA